MELAANPSEANLRAFLDQVSASFCAFLSSYIDIDATIHSSIKKESKNKSEDKSEDRKNWL